MNNIVPIGSIVEVNSSKYCIVGYGDINKDGKELSGYYGVICPIGFTNLKHLAFIPYSHITKVVFTGYSTEMSEFATKTIAKKDDLSEKHSKEEILEARAHFNKIFEKYNRG